MAERLIAPKTVEITFHVRFAETDQMHIVHHSNYLIWFEEARSALLRVVGTSYTAFEAEGLALAVSQIDVRYLKPARYDRLVAVQCTLHTLKSRKMTFHYKVLDVEASDLLATGVTDHICITPSGQVSRIPTHWLKLLA